MRVNVTRVFDDATAPTKSRSQSNAAHGRRWRKRCIPCQSACPAGGESHDLDVVYWKARRTLFIPSISSKMCSQVVLVVPTRPCESIYCHTDSADGHPQRMANRKNELALTYCNAPRWFAGGHRTTG